MTFVEREVENENTRRKQTYLGQCADWLLVARQDQALGIAVRPFPAVPKLRVIEEVDGSQFDVDSAEPVCEPLFKLVEGKGTFSISTPLKVGVPSKGSLR